MFSQSELKTLIPSLVASGVLVYESITGNKISDSQSTELTNGILIGAGYMVTLWGIWKNHQKAKPPTSVPRETNIIEETQPKAVSGPIVTQADVNKVIQGS